MPLVSIIIPFFDYHKFVPMAIEGALNQDYTNCEVIVVCDGSEACYVEKIQAQFSGRVSVFWKPHGGSASAYNWGIWKAKGKYCAINDSDDLSHPSRISAQVQLLEADEDIVLVGAQAETFDERGRVVPKRAVPLSDSEIRREIFLGNPFVHSTVTFRRDKIIDAKMYNNQRIMADFGLWLKLFGMGKMQNTAQIFSWRIQRDIRHTSVPRRISYLQILKNYLNFGPWSSDPIKTALACWIAFCKYALALILGRFWR